MLINALSATGPGSPLNKKVKILPFDFFRGRLPCADPAPMSEGAGDVRVVRDELQAISCIGDMDADNLCEGSFFGEGIFPMVPYLDCSVAKAAW
jgi:hypothetical protein